MTEYALYLESGPRRRTTMVHVIDLLGCIARGSTTEEALYATPEAIHTYLGFLRRHGERVDPIERFTTVIAEHVTEGPWIGYGDPAPGFGPDFQTLESKDLAVYLRRLSWLREDLLGLVRDLSPETMLAAPEGRGRPVHAILAHVASAHCAYVRSALGKADGLTEALREAERGPEGVISALTELWLVSESRLAAITEKERSQLVPHGQVTWTARRALRRTLEHEWEHLLELAVRLEKPVG